jgi:glutathione S-transferase
MESEVAFTDLSLITVSAFGDHPYALQRYVNESRRLYRTMDKSLAKNPSGYIVGDHLTIADIAIWPWTTAYSTSSLPPRGKKTSKT